MQVSPLGAVPKKDVDPRHEVRLIHDLSYPRDLSTSDASVKAGFPCVKCQHVAAIARRIEHCHALHPDTAVMILKGDVKSAFRHLMIASEHVRWMAARVPQLQALVFDMSAPFGWLTVILRSLRKCDLVACGSRKPGNHKQWRYPRHRAVLPLRVGGRSYYGRIRHTSETGVCEFDITSVHDGYLGSTSHQWSKVLPVGLTS